METSPSVTAIVPAGRRATETENQGMKQAERGERARQRRQSVLAMGSLLARCVVEARASTAEMFEGQTTTTKRQQGPPRAAPPATLSPSENHAR